MAEPYKSTGTTAGERFLAQLCRTSFLSLWSRSNPHTDDGKDFSKPTSVGKELCDQLVVFDRHVIILSDKDCRYTDNPNPEVNWTRYYKTAIWKSAGQLWQAEKWLRHHRDRLYEDATCEHPLQVILPPLGEMIVHRILVVHGVQKECRKALGGYGSFALDTRLVGDAHIKVADEPVRPFVFGQVNPSKGFVHLFDDITLPAVMRTLDTISDFVEYLEKKERFLSEPGRVVYAASELELLADYLRNLDEEERHNFPKLKPNAVVEYEAGEFATLFKSREWARKIKADKISYLWDFLIEYITKHFVADTMFFSSDKSLTANERGLRFLAQEGRVERRMLAGKLSELIENTPPGKRRMVLSFSERRPGLCFAILTVPPSKSESEDEQYRKTRRDFLELYCLVVKLRFFEKVLDIVGIATESGAMHTVDLMHYNCREGWQEGEKELAETVQKELGFLTNAVESYVQTDEYPEEF